jgi:hypothetical protein
VLNSSCDLFTHVFKGRPKIDSPSILMDYKPSKHLFPSSNLISFQEDFDIQPYMNNQ